MALLFIISFSLLLSFVFFNLSSYLNTLVILEKSNPGIIVTQVTQVTLVTQVTVVTLVTLVTPVTQVTLDTLLVNLVTLVSQIKLFFCRVLFSLLSVIISYRMCKTTTLCGQT